MPVTPSSTTSQYLSGKGLVLKTPLTDQESFLCWSWSNEDLAETYIPTIQTRLSTLGRFELRPQSLMINGGDLFPSTATTEIVFPKQVAEGVSSVPAEGVYLGIKIPKHEGRSQVECIPLTAQDTIFINQDRVPCTLHLHRKTGPFPSNSYSLGITSWQGYTVLETEKPTIEEKSVGDHVWVCTRTDSESVTPVPGGVISLPDTDVAVFLS